MEEMAPQTQAVRIETPISDKSRGLAFVICLIFGLLGFHRFYLGKMGSGVIYFFTLGILGLGWIFDIIQIGLGNMKDNMGYLVRRW